MAYYDITIKGSNVKFTFNSETQKLRLLSKKGFKRVKDGVRRKYIKDGYIFKFNTAADYRHADGFKYKNFSKNDRQFFAKPIKVVYSKDIPDLEVLSVFNLEKVEPIFDFKSCKNREKTFTEGEWWNCCKKCDLKNKKYINTYNRLKEKYADILFDIEPAYNVNCGLVKNKLFIYDYGLVSYDDYH